MFNVDSKDKEAESSLILLKTPGKDGDCSVHHAKIGKSPIVIEENETESV